MKILYSCPGPGQGPKPPISLNGSIPPGGATQRSACAIGGPASAYGEANEAGAFSQPLQVSLVDPKLRPAIAKASAGLLEATTQGDLSASFMAWRELSSLQSHTLKQYVGIRLGGTDPLHLKRVEIFGWK